MSQEQNTKYNINLSEFPDDVTIPMVLLQDKNLNAHAIKLYAIIKAIMEDAAFCSITNKCLANLMGKSTATIQRSLKLLENRNYLAIVTGRNGIYWERYFFL